MEDGATCLCCVIWWKKIDKKYSLSDKTIHRQQPPILWWTQNKQVTGSLVASNMANNLVLFYGIIQTGSCDPRINLWIQIT